MQVDLQNRAQQQYEKEVSEFQTRENEFTSHQKGESSTVTDEEKFNFSNPLQQVFLINLAHRGKTHKPHSLYPAFRVLGGFPHKEALQQHVKNVNRMNPQALSDNNLYMTFFGKKQLIPVEASTLQDYEYIEKKINNLNQAIEQDVNYRNQEFVENKNRNKELIEAEAQDQLQKKVDLQEIKKSNVGQSRKHKPKTDLRDKLLRKKYEQEAQNKFQDGTVSSMIQIAGQKYVVYSYIPDNSETVQQGLADPEPAFIIWQIFDDENDAQHYLENTASKKIKHCYLDLYNAYQWIYPTLMDPDKCQVKEKARHGVLTKQLKANKQNPLRVKNFTNWLKEDGKQVPELEVGYNPATGESVVLKDTTQMVAEAKISHGSGESLKTMMMKMGDQPIDELKWDKFANLTQKDGEFDITFEDRSFNAFQMNQQFQSLKQNPSSTTLNPFVAPENLNVPQFVPSQQSMNQNYVNDQVGYQPQTELPGSHNFNLLNGFKFGEISHNNVEKL